MNQIKILFCGNYRKTSGPRYVNRQYMKYFPQEIDYLKNSNTVLELIEAFFKTIKSDVIILSGARYINIPIIYWAKFLKKRCIYIAHGCTKVVVAIDNIPPTSYTIKIERICIDKSDLILCVSVPFLETMKNEYPEAAHKMKELTNPVDWDELDKTGSNNNTKDSNLIISAGGERNIKKNLKVAQAIELLNMKNKTKLQYKIYGAKSDSEICKAIESIPCVSFPGFIAREEFFDSLNEAALYVQNSVFEAFGLAPIEALLHGNDLLISKYVGAKDIIKGLRPEDIINNPDDIEEVAQKIVGVMKNGNNKRLLSSIDRETTSGQFIVNRLLKYCHDLVEQED